MTGEKDARAGMPEVEEIARVIDGYAFKSWQQAHDYEMKTTGDAEEAVKFADWSAGTRVSEARDKARAILALFARILAEKEAWAERGWSAYRIAHDQAMENGAAAQTARAALAAERERCAKIADDNADNDSRGDSPYDNGAGSCGYRKACYDIAAAIRAQGE